MSSPKALARIHARLFETLGPQGWWPGDGTVDTIVIGAVLTQNAAWTNVEKALARMHAAGVRTLGDVQAAEESHLAELIRPSGYFRVKAARLRSVAEGLRDLCGFAWDSLEGVPTPALRERLLALHGIGPETADDILVYAFGRTSFVIDAYTRRLMERHGLAKANDTYDALQARWHAALPPLLVDYNEGHALVVKLAKLWCSKGAPNCAECPLLAEEFFASRAAFERWKREREAPTSRPRVSVRSRRTAPEKR